ncbi:MAG: hypothetical protein ABEH64_14105 [Salinirussus sp.]
MSLLFIVDRGTLAREVFPYLRATASIGYLIDVLAVGGFAVRFGLLLLGYVSHISL